jgi:ADP-heptose:LPS heptosyltransferase
MNHPLKRVSYLVRNPFLYLYLKCLDCFLSFLKIFYFPSKTKKTPQNILIIQFAHKGDAILATSILPLIKKRYPETKISMLVGSWSKELLHQHPDIDFLHLFDHPKLNRSTLSFLKKWLVAFKQFFPLIQNLKKCHYTHSIDLSCYYPNSHILTWLASIPERIGYESGGGGPLLTHSHPWHYIKQHMSLYYADLLKNLNIFPEGKKPLKNSLYPTPSKESFAQLETKFSLKKPFLIFHPYSGYSLKHWQDSEWKKLLSAFKYSCYTIVFTGASSQERASIDAIIKGADHALNLAGLLSFEELKSLVFSSRALIAVDTMIGHLAASYNIPTITLFSGIADPIHWKPSHEKHLSLYTQLPCFPCLKKRGCSHLNCIRSISPDSILKALESFEIFTQI